MTMIEIAIVAVIAVAVFFALRRIVIMRRSGCSCGCSGCCADCGGGCGTACRKDVRSKAIR